MVASFIVLALAVAGANALTINTPTGSLNECQNSLLTWDGATGRTQISVFPQGVTTGSPLETLPVQTGNSYTWLVDLAPGLYTLVIKDLETGETAASGAAQVTPNPDNDTSCEGKNGSSAPGTGGSTPPGDSTTPPGEQTTPPAPTQSTPSNTTPPPTDNNSNPSNTSPTNSNSTPSPTETQPNGAASLSAKSATGVLGLLAAFLLA